MNGYETTLFEREQDALYRLLDRGKDVNAPDENGELMLVNAASEDNYSDFVTMLLRFGADVFRRDSDGTNAIEAAFLNEHGNIDVLNAVVGGVPLPRDLSRLYRICTAKKPLNERPSLRADGYPNGMTALMAVVSFKRPASVIQQLIDAGSDVNEKDVSGWSALRFARDFDTVELLIKNGADVNTADNDDDMFIDDIFDAPRAPDLQTLRLVLKNGATKETVQRLWSDLTEQLWRGQNNSDVLKAVRLLLEAGADINGLSCHKKEYPFRELMLNEAVRYGSLSLVKYLLKHGADPNKPDGDGYTALCGCRRYEGQIPWLAAAKTLIRFGADPYYRYIDKTDPEKSHTFLETDTVGPYRDEIVAYYEKNKKRN